MRISSVLVPNRRRLATAVILTLLSVAGCGDPSNMGESTAVPSTPPPGRDGTTKKATLAKVYDPKEKAKSVRRGRPIVGKAAEAPATTDSQ
jgi:hypothetical protein